MATKQTSSPWVWVFLFLMLALFAGFILFLDQKIVRSKDGSSKATTSQPKSTKPTIDFYSVLPDRKVEIPVSEQEREGIANPSINKTDGKQVMLQVGSFQTLGDADSLKAELAFLGLEAKIESAQVNSETWHRVKIGPYSENSEFSRTKNLLIENRIKYIQLSLTP